MSFVASSSSSAGSVISALRSSARSAGLRKKHVSPITGIRSRQSASSRYSEPSSSDIEARHFAAAALQQEEMAYPPSEQEQSPGNTQRPGSQFGMRSDSSPSSPSSRSNPNSRPRRSAYEAPSLTPEGAQSYLSDLLHLPPSHAFSPDLSMQILTHKSYRYAHLIRTNRPISSRHSYSLASSESEQPEQVSEGPSSVSHNARLSFLGRRALATYLALFVHSHLRTDRGLRGVDFLRGRKLEEKLEALRHVNTLGREVGSRWGVGEVMRWDRNPTGVESGDLKIKGLTVEAILGGIFTQHGSPAAHRAFHLHVLPHFSEQLRDPLLVERAEVTRRDVEKEFGGGIVLP